MDAVKALLQESDSDSLQEEENIRWENSQNKEKSGCPTDDTSNPPSQAHCLPFAIYFHTQFPVSQCVTGKRLKDPKFQVQQLMSQTLLALSPINSFPGLQKCYFIYWKSYIIFFRSGQFKTVWSQKPLVNAGRKGIFCMGLFPWKKHYIHWEFPNHSMLQNIRMGLL